MAPILAVLGVLFVVDWSVLVLLCCSRFEEADDLLRVGCLVMGLQNVDVRVM